MSAFDLRMGDCLEVMATLAPGSVDLVLSDPPYGTTACSWDTVIPFEPMWREVWRVLKPNGAAVFTASQPFTSALVMSQVKRFKYQWVWEKDKSTGHLNANRRPMVAHEDVLVFCGLAPNYYPCMVETGVPSNKSAKAKRASTAEAYGKFEEYQRGGATHRFPRSVLKINTVNSAHGVQHPTQKPVALMEYLIRTYTNGGETVLDFTMGSGTTGVACANTARRFIGIEKDPKYYEIARSRVSAAYGLTQDEDIFA